MSRCHLVLHIESGCCLWAFSTLANETATKLWLEVKIVSVPFPLIKEDLVHFLRVFHSLAFLLWKQIKQSKFNRLFICSDSCMMVCYTCGQLINIWPSSLKFYTTTPKTSLITSAWWPFSTSCVHRRTEIDNCGRPQELLSITLMTSPWRIPLNRLINDSLTFKLDRWI